MPFTNPCLSAWAVVCLNFLIKAGVNLMIGAEVLAELVGDNYRVIGCVIAG